MVAQSHKCSRMHGHSFRVQVHIRGPVDPKLGWVMDFADMANAFKPLFEQLDHKCLNDIDGLENPTSENLAKWIWAHLNPTLPNLHKIIVQEDSECGVIYAGEDR